MDVVTQEMTWREIGVLGDIPKLRARTLLARDGDVAVFRTSDDRVFALRDSCPHKGGRLSQGIVHDGFVTCPLHGWTIGLADGEAGAPDSGCARRVPVGLDGDRILIAIEPGAKP
jgi:nitrite reductase (NADH) small subunit